MRGILLRSIGVLAALLMVSGAAQAALIDFEGLPLGTGSGPLILSGVTFTSDTGDWIIYDSGTSQEFCGLASNCQPTVTVDFGAGVNNLTFDTGGDNNSGVQATAAIFVSGVYDSTVNIVYDGDGLTTEFVDLSAYSNITKIVLANTDPYGVGWDNFSFDSVAVPVPASLWLLGSAIGLLGWMRRKEV